MRTFAISDIHGNNELFKKALKQLGLKKTDRLLLLGDLIDRGTDTKGVLDSIILLREMGFKIECLMGNHERMFLDSLEDNQNLSQWLLNGGDKTLLSFLTASIDRIPQKYIEFIRSFRMYIELDNFIFVHAALNMNLDDPFKDGDVILWERDPYKYLNKAWLGNRKLVHGHNPQSKLEILSSIRGNKEVICIDNGTFIKRDNFGSLCVLEVEKLKLHFVDENS